MTEVPPRNYSQTNHCSSRHCNWLSFAIFHLSPSFTIFRVVINRNSCPGHGPTSHLVISHHLPPPATTSQLIQPPVTSHQLPATSHQPPEPACCTEGMNVGSMLISFCQTVTHSSYQIQLAAILLYLIRPATSHHQPPATTSHRQTCTTNHKQAHPDLVKALCTGYAWSTPFVTAFGHFAPHRLSTGVALPRERRVRLSLLQKYLRAANSSGR